MASVTFICGCESGELLDIKSIEQGFMSLVRFDEDGMLECKNHGARRKGWRSLPTFTYVPDAGESEETIPPPHTDYNMAGNTLQEIERFIVFDVPLPEYVVSI